MKAVATYQTGILICILVYFALLACQFAVPQEARIILGVVFLLDAMASTVFVFLPSMKVYNVGLGVLMGILAMIPCLGLIVLLMVNNKATNILKANGHKVGLLGANLWEF